MKGDEMSRHNRLRHYCGSPALALCLAGVAWLAPNAQEAPFSFSTVDFPGGANTAVLGINRAGDIVGTYQDQAKKTHGFVRRQGKFQSVDFPGAEYTLSRGIGPSGDVVGSYRLPGEPAANLHGFVLDKQGRFSRVDFPGHTSTVLMRVAPDGSMVGCYHDADQLDTMYAMRVSGKKFTGFDRATTMHTGATPDGKIIVGFYTDRTVPLPAPRPGESDHSGHGHGYVLEGTRFTSFDVPGSTMTQAHDISPSGVIVGIFQDVAGKTHGFLRRGTAYTTIDVPQSASTAVLGINEAETIVGTFTDGSGTRHGLEGRGGSR